MPPKLTSIELRFHPNNKVKAEKRKNQVWRPGRHHCGQLIQISDLLEKRADGPIRDRDGETDADAGHGSAISGNESEGDAQDSHDQRK